VGQRRADGVVDGVQGMLRPHDPLVVDGDVVEHVVGVDVLQVGRADQVVVGHPGDRQDRRLLDLRVQQPVEHVHRARRGGGEADAELAGELRVPDGRHRGHFLVPHVDVAQLVLPLAQRLHEAVDAVAREPEDHLGAPFDQPVDDDVGNRPLVSHSCLPPVVSRWPPPRR
jgi:hypothetical protein